MSKLTKVLGAFLVFALGGSASAVQFKFSGYLDNRANIYTNQAGFFAAAETMGTGASGTGAAATPVSGDDIKEAWADFRWRLQAEAASDDKVVRGVFALEIGAVRFGNALGRVGPNSGGAFSGDGVNIETRFAYLDVGLPSANRLTFGLMPVAVNKWLWQETAGGFQVKKDAPIGYTLGWGRGIERFSTADTDSIFADADNIFGRVDFKPSPTSKAGVFALYQHRNPNLTPAPAAGTTPAVAPTTAFLLKNFGDVDYNYVSLGLDGGITSGPLFANIDFIYQTGKTNNTIGAPAAPVTQSLDINAFFVHADLGANLGKTRVVYTGWYSSGDDDNTDGDRKNYTATDVDIAESVVFGEAGYTNDNYFTESPYFADKGAIFNKVGVDYKATEKVTVGGAAILAMTAEDLTIGPTTAPDTSNYLGTEIDAFVSYKFYPGMELAVNGGYLIAGDGMDAFEAAAFKDGSADSNIFRTTLRFAYTF